MHCTYITTEKLDIGNFSGTGFYIPQALEKNGVEIEYLDGLKDSNLFREKLKRKYFEKIHKKKYFINRHPEVLKGYSNQIKKRLNNKTDVILGPSSRPFALLDTKTPFVFWTDAVFANMVEFYPEYSDVANITIKYGNLMEQEALSRCKLAVYSSEWAAQSAIKHYNVPEEKVKVVTYGANIENELSLEEIKTSLEKKQFTTCNLLFIGVHWKRKGGDKALAIAKYLNQNGLKTTLNIVGVEPETNEPLPDYVHAHGFISKATKQGKKKLLDLIAQSHFLILPTIADCTPIVYAEFNSFGIPVLTTNVGGIPSIIKNNVNGWMFNLKSSVEEYGKRVMELFENDVQYKALALSSYNEYVTRLNWNVSGKNFKKLLEETL